MKSQKKTLAACYIGYIVQAISINVPPVLFIIFQEDFGITFEQLGRLVLITFFVQMLVDVVMAKLIAKTGYRAPSVIAHLLAAVGFGMMALAPNLFPGHVYGGLVLAACIYAVGSGLIEVLISPIVQGLSFEEKGPAMSLLHSFYCWGQLGAVLISTLLLLILGRDHWQWIMAIWMLVPLINVVLFWNAPLPEVEAGEEMGGLRRLFKSKLFWIAALIMVASGASEQAMSQWASLFAQKGLQLNKTLGDLAGPCFFALLMGIGRMLYGIKGAKLNIKNMLTICGLLCIVCYLTVVLSPWPMLSLLACGVCGLSVSLMWPGTLVIAADALPGAGTALFALMAMGGDIGCSAGPWLTGFVSDAAAKSQWLLDKTGMEAEQVALRAGLIAAVVFPVTLVLLVRCIGRKRKET